MLNRPFKVELRNSIEVKTSILIWSRQTIVGDPTCWLECWNLPRQTWIDVCTASTSVLRRDPPQEPAKEQSGAAAADRTPTPKSVTEPPNTSRVTLRNSQGTVQCSLSQYAQELASIKKTIWTCVPQKFVGKPLYTWALSLSWQLHTWTRGSHPGVHVPSSGASLTWALLLTLLWLSYLCMILLSA